MKTFLHFLSSILRDRFGNLALGAFLLSVLSGIFLVVPYDVNRPFESVRDMLLMNGFASFSRNLHYWSSQFFLVFTLLHTWEYLLKEDFPALRRGVWFRLVAALVFSVLVMLTGFILKGDADSLQARRIMESLLRSVPFAGNILTGFFIGKADSFQLIYVHHIATATIILLVIIVEHARVIWVRRRLFVLLTLATGLVSLVFRAPLHDNLNPVVKGPWYLVGLQEVLHLMKHPGWSMLILFLILTGIYFIPHVRYRTGFIIRKTLLFTFYLYGILSLTAYFFRGARWEWIWPWEQGYRSAVYFPFQPDLPVFSPDTAWLASLEQAGKVESCMACHSGMKGFSPSHDPEALGCFICHRGDPYTLRKNRSHRNMLAVPGNLRDAELSCGTADCHPDIPHRVNRSIMNTASGMVNTNRFVFGESPSPGLLADIREIGHTPADVHLRNLCAFCHLGNEKTAPGAVHQGSRGGGCNACHLTYSGEALADLKRRDQPVHPDSLLPLYHPSLSIDISGDKHCFGCHSRSGRISTSYEGWHETLLETLPAGENEAYRIIDDGRIYLYKGEDVHHAAGLDCTDCHTSSGLMGDGRLYPHKEDQVKVSCEDCHPLHPSETVVTEDLDEESLKIARLRGWEIPGRIFLRGKKEGAVFLNTLEQNNHWFLEGKKSGRLHPLLPPAEICTRGTAHSHLHCSACHTGWAPSCIGCHNEYEAGTPGYDLLLNRERMGTWVEYVGLHNAHPPALGVKEGMRDTGRIILPATPGMIISIDKSGFTGHSGETIFHRLFAPVEAHTTMAEGRSCKSCHNNPVALGYGEGNLEYRVEGDTGHWVFTPRYALHKADHLPEDAWIGFEKEGNPPYSTRTNFRPFSREEQRKILLAGSCLECHPEDSETMLESLESFSAVLKKRSKKCIVPAWADSF